MIFVKAKKSVIFLIFAKNIDRGAVLLSTHNLCFRAKIRKKYTLVNPSFNIQKWGVRGSTIHGHVSMMTIMENINKTGLFFPTSSERSSKLSNVVLQTYSFTVANRQWDQTGRKLLARQS